MKKYINQLLAVIVFLFIYSSSFAQDDEPAYKPATPRWVSDKGFWVVERNIYSPRNFIIYFYNNNSELVYKEKVQGVYLDLEKRRIKMNLKKALEVALLAWGKQQKILENESLVANLLQNK
jgi:hypothetical protein